MTVSEPSAKPDDALRLFEAFLAERGLRPEAMVPWEGIDAMFAFFRTQRFAFEGNDALLFQYGTYDWGNGRHFELDITRQFAVDDTDAETDEDDGGGIYQLSLTFVFVPAPDRAELGSDHEWCFARDAEAVDEYEAFVRRSAAYRLLAETQPLRVEIDYEDVC